MRVVRAHCPSLFASLISSFITSAFEATVKTDDRLPWKTWSDVLECCNTWMFNEKGIKKNNNKWIGEVRHFKRKKGHDRGWTNCNSCYNQRWLCSAPVDTPPLEAEVDEQVHWALSALVSPHLYQQSRWRLFEVWQHCAREVILAETMCTLFWKTKCICFNNDNNNDNNL